MTATLIGTFESGSPGWHAARAGGLGGSEISAVLGLSPFESRFSLWHRKAGAVGPVEEAPEMYWGKVLEPVIIAEFERRHPDWYVVQTGTWAHEERWWQVGNPDALLYRSSPYRSSLAAAGVRPPDRILETKLSMFGDGWGEDGTDQVPPHVRCQCIWYGDVLGVDTVHVCVFIASGLDVRTYTLTWEPAEAELLRDAGERFLADVAQGVRPDIDEHTATYQVIREMHPDIDGTSVELSNDVARGFIDAKTAERLAVDSAREAAARVADEMGNAHKATWDGRVIATRQARDGGTPFVKAARGLTSTDTPELAGVTSGPIWTDPDTGETF